jgi:hypothetical protein
MGVGFVEFTGSTSGTTTRVSGGQIVGQATAGTGPIGTFTSGGDFLIVNDVSDFEVDDRVQVDVGNDGLFTGTTNGIDETVSYFVKTVGTTGISLSTTSGGATLDITGAIAAAGGRITNYNFTSFNAEVREIEPVITGLQVGAGNQVTENEVGTFKIENQGGRSLTVKKLRFEVSGSYNTASGFAPKNFKLDRADSTTGTRISNTLNNGSSLGSPKLAYTLTGAVGNAVVAGAKAAGQTSITIDDGAGAASNTTLVAGDRVTFTGDTNGGAGYKLTAVTTTSLTITPALQVGIADNATITAVATGATIGATSILESGVVIEFDIAGASITEEIAGNSSKGYVVLADTTNIKNNTSQGTTATTQLRMLGSKASPTPGATDGLVWKYVSTLDGSTVDNLTISDSYIVSGKSLLYQ